MATRSNHLQDDRDAHDLVESLELAIRQITGFLSRFEQHARTNMATMSENLTTVDRRLAVLEAKAASTTLPAVGLASADQSPRESVQQVTDSEPQNVDAAPVPPPPPAPPAPVDS